MQTTEHNLPAFWSTYLRTRRQPPFIHPEDEKYLYSIDYWKDRPDLRKALSFRDYIRSPRFGDVGSGFHFSLQPMPYAGDLSRAVVFILLLNPGFSPNDYYAEYHDAQFKKCLDQNLRQTFWGVEFPFFYLDPRFCWTTGFQWWESKLRRIMEALARRHFQSNYRRAMQFVASKIASIELVPYHSSSFNDNALIGHLPSAKKAKAAAASIAQHIHRRGGCLIVTRKVAFWDIVSTEDHILCYSAAEARGAHLTPGTRGGRMILEKLEAAYLKDST